MKIDANLTAENFDRYNQQSPVECYKLNIVAVYCIILLVSSLVFNSLLLWIFYLHKELRSSLNMLIIALTIFNLAGSCIEFPLVITTNLKCRWVFGKTGCYISGVIMYSVGSIGVYLMTAISFERFFIIYKPLSIKSISNKVILIVIAICSFLGSLWAIAPLMGWSYYSLEGALTSCSVEWAERSANVISYNITIFIFLFVIPFGIIVVTNVKLLFIIRNLPKINKDSQDAKAKKRLATERNLTIIMMILIGGFVLSWTPYAIVALYSAFVNNDLPPLGGTLPAMFAKSSMVWSSILYIFSNKQIRVKVTKGLFTKKREEMSFSRDKSISGSQAATETNRV